MTVTLISEVDTFLYIREGEGQNGTILHENDDIQQSENLNSRIVETLSSGTYTIEATTYNSGAVGAFTLTVSGLAAAATSTPTPTPEPTPEPTPANACIETLAGSSVSGTWNSDCESSEREGSYARYYTFTVTDESDVIITLTSEVDTFLYIREGVSKSGTILHEDDDDDANEFDLPLSTDSGIKARLEEGRYTIEATTYKAGLRGNFTLVVSASGEP